jgi:hypothetical protein
MNVGPICNVLSLVANMKHYSASSSMMYDDVISGEDVRVSLILLNSAPQDSFEEASRLYMLQVATF